MKLNFSSSEVECSNPLCLLSLCFLCCYVKIFISPQFCWRQHLHISLNMEKSNWCLTRAFAPTDSCSWYWKVHYILPKSKGKHQPRHEPLSPQWWPAWMIGWCNNGPNVVGKPTALWQDLRRTAQEGVHAWHFPGSQQPQTWYGRTLRENQKLLFC